MKKSPLKLKLNRETLHTLGQPQLEAVAGGTGSDCYGSSCTPGCNTSPTGGSRYC